MWIGKISFCLLLRQSITLASSTLIRTAISKNCFVTIRDFDFDSVQL